jgi:hypothetical protein
VNTAASTPVIISLSPGGFHLPASCRGLTPLLGIGAATAYCEDITPDIWRLHQGNMGAAQDWSFLIRVGAGNALRLSKGQETTGFSFSHRDLSPRTVAQGPPSERKHSPCAQ